MRRQIPTLLAALIALAAGPRFVGVASAAEPVPGACDAVTLMGAVSEADHAFVIMDGSAFADAVARLDETLACTTEALTPAHVVAYHRTRALASFFGSDDAATMSSFQAALATMPGFILPLEIAPEGHPLRARYEEAKLYATASDLALQEPAEGWITIDGSRTFAAPSGRPFVFQRFGADGTLLETRYVPVGQPWPEYPTRPPPPPPPVLPAPLPRPLPQPVRPPPRTKAAPLALGVTLDVVAAGLYGLAFVSRANYDEAVLNGTEDRIRSTHLTTNALVGGSIGAMVIGTSLVVASF